MTNVWQRKSTPKALPSEKHTNVIDCKDKSSFLEVVQDFIADTTIGLVKLLKEYYTGFTDQETETLAQANQAHNVLWTKSPNLPNAQPTVELEEAMAAEPLGKRPPTFNRLPASNAHTAIAEADGNSCTTTAHGDNHTHNLVVQVTMTTDPHLSR